MRVLVLSGLLIAWMASARSFAAEVLMEDPLSSLGAWQAKPPPYKLPVAKRVELTIDGKRWTGEGELAAHSSQTLSEKRVFDLDEPMLKVSTFQGDCEVPPYSISRILLHFED